MVLKFKSDNNKLKTGLYIVSTPIGNLNDLSFRALQVLKDSDYILCEDTRVTHNLLKRYEIKNNLISNHKFNEKKNLIKIIELLKSGSIISLVSDAGVPCVSDPGSLLINECLKNKINVTPIPGPSAVTTAISISGFSEKFIFYGFLPEKHKLLNDDLEKLSNLNYSFIFFISAKKLHKSLIIFKKYFSGRKILICREMTKIYEEFIRDDVDNILVTDHTLKGELTVVISDMRQEKKTSQILSESVKHKIKLMIKKLSTKEITSIICSDTKISKKDVYDYCLKLKK